jgi:hypothetical protein
VELEDSKDHQHEDDDHHQRREQRCEEPLPGLECEPGGRR